MAVDKGNNGFFHRVEEYMIFHRMADSVNKSNFNLSVETTLFLFPYFRTRQKNVPIQQAFGAVLEHIQLRCSFPAVDVVTNTIS